MMATFFSSCPVVIQNQLMDLNKHSLSFAFRMVQAKDSFKELFLPIIGRSSCDLLVTTAFLQGSKTFHEVSQSSSLRCWDSGSPLSKVVCFISGSQVCPQNTHIPTIYVTLKCNPVNVDTITRIQMIKCEIHRQPSQDDKHQTEHWNVMHHFVAGKNNISITRSKNKKLITCNYTCTPCLYFKNSQRKYVVAITASPSVSHHSHISPGINAETICSCPN